MPFTPAGDHVGTVGSTIEVTADPMTAPGTTSPTTPPTTERSPFESAALAGQLVDVVGYRYTDVSDDERTREVAGLPGSVSAASFHDVVDRMTGEEVGRLVLLVFPPDSAWLAPGNAESLAAQVLGTTAVTRAELSGHEVWLAEDPSQSAWHVQYLWTRHGTVGGLGAPCRAEADAFLAAYFAVPYLGIEAPILATRVVGVPGFGYTDASDRTTETDAAAIVVPGATASLHNVFDSTHMFAGLVLVGPVAAADAEELENLVHGWLVEAYGLEAAGALENLGTTTMGGADVLHLRCAATAVHIYSWYWPSTQVAGWMMTTRPDLADQFLPSYQALQPAGS